MCLYLLQAMGKYGNMFAHIVIEPVSNDQEEGVLSFAAKHGCLAHIENVCFLGLGNPVGVKVLFVIKPAFHDIKLLY